MERLSEERRRLALAADGLADAATNADGYRRAADLAERAGCGGAAAGYRFTAKAIANGEPAPVPVPDLLVRVRQRRAAALAETERRGEL